MNCHFICKSIFQDASERENLYGISLNEVVEDDDDVIDPLYEFD
jgi:hypothetical protein